MRMVLLALVGCSASTMHSADLAGVDLAGVDLAGVDLASANDLAASANDLAHTPFHLLSDFNLADGSMWPAPWTILGGVQSATIAGGRGRIVPMTSSYSLGRMGASAAVRDVEVTFNLEFESIGTQGIGFYVRQNGGWLGHTNPTGAGYAIFVEGFRGARMAMWHEIDGSETEIASSAATLTLASNVIYQVRFRVTGANPTRMQARLWPSGQSEPGTWQIDITDSAGPQGAGGFAIDSWSTATSGTLSVGTSVDDVEVTEM
jgi:hypothetical protein